MLAEFEAMFSGNATQRPMFTLVRTANSETITALLGAAIEVLWGKLWGKHKNLFLPIDKLAEAVRFELTEDSHPRRFSRPVP